MKKLFVIMVLVKKQTLKRGAHGPGYVVQEHDKACC